MKRVLKLVSSILLLSVMGGHLYADEKANVVKQGTIRGRIIDTSKQTLPGASIYIENLKTGVISDVYLRQPQPGDLYGKSNLCGICPRRNENNHSRRQDTRKRCHTERRSRIAGNCNRRCFSGTAPCHQLTKEQSGHQKCSFCRPGRQVSGFKHRRCTETYFGYQRTV